MAPGDIINYKNMVGLIIAENNKNDYSVFVGGNMKRLFYCSQGWGEIVETDKRIFWECDGMYHREDGPAAIYPDGTKEWYEFGVLHRADGLPAIIEGASGLTYWYFKGQLHRNYEDPAYDAPGYKEWWVSGSCIRSSE